MQAESFPKTVPATFFCPPSSAKAFLALLDLTQLAQQFPIDDLLCDVDLLIARSAASGGLVIYDAQLRSRLEMEVAAEAGFRVRGRSGTSR